MKKNDSSVATSIFMWGLFLMVAWALWEIFSPFIQVLSTHGTQLMDIIR